MIAERLVIDDIISDTNISMMKDDIFMTPKGVIYPPKGEEGPDPDVKPIMIKKDTSKFSIVDDQSTDGITILEAARMCLNKERRAGELAIPEFGVVDKQQ